MVNISCFMEWCV